MRDEVQCDVDAVVEARLTYALAEGRGQCAFLQHEIFDGRFLHAALRSALGPTFNGYCHTY